MITIEEVQGLWARIRLGVRQRNRRLDAILDSATPHSVSDGVLTIAVPYPFHRDLLGEEWSRAIIEEVVFHVLGDAYRVHVIGPGGLGRGAPVAEGLRSAAGTENTASPAQVMPQLEEPPFLVVPATTGALEQIRANWPAIRNATGAIKPSLVPLLVTAEPRAMEGETLTIVAPRSDHCGLLNDDANRRLVERAIATVVGEECRLECVSPAYAQWLADTVTESRDGRYRHRLLRENPASRGDILNDLSALVERAHEDARRHFRQLAGISLDPLGETTVPDPMRDYPRSFPMRTLQGYFGEIIAGFVAEHFAPFKISDWRVPAFLFRFHNTAFEWLERARQGALVPQEITGRTGDDCLAFQRDAAGRIVRSLVCEAKCTTGHRADSIADAHAKISEPHLRPVSLSQLIHVLEDRRDDPESTAWAEALRHLWLADLDASYERYDLVSYVCGQLPVRGSTWITTDKPHTNYTASRRLEAVELHLQDVAELVREVYGVGDGR